MNKQRMRFTDEELELIKSTFADNEDMLITVRKIFLQKPFNEIDKANLKIIKDNPKVLGIIKKSILPEIDPEAPLNQVVDLMMTVRLDEKSLSEQYTAIKARKLLIDYIDMVIKNIEEDSPAMSLDSMTDITEDAEQTVINIIARNTLIGHVELQLSGLSILAGKREESVDETKKRLEQDSTK